MGEPGRSRGPNTMPVRGKTLEEEQGARGRAGGWRRKRDREQPARSYGTFSRTKEATIGSDVRRRFIKIRIYRRREAEKGFPAAPPAKTRTLAGSSDKNTSPLASTPCRLARRRFRGVARLSERILTRISRSREKRDNWMRVAIQLVPDW